MKVIVRWSVERPEAVVRSSGRAGSGPELRVELSAAIRLALDLADRGALPPALAQELASRLLGHPGLSASLLVDPASSWSGLLSLQAGEGDGPTRPLWLVHARWTGERWEVLRLSPPSPARWLLSQLSERLSRQMPPVRRVAAAMATLLLLSSATFWGHVERLGAVPALVFARGEPASEAPTLGILLLPPASAGTRNDRGVATRALEACLEAGVQTVLVDVPLDLPGPGLTGLSAAMAASPSRVIGGVSSSLRGVDDPPAGVPLALLGMPYDTSRGAGVGLAVSLEADVLDATGDHLERLDTAPLALAGRIAAASRRAGEALVPVPVFSSDARRPPWVVFALPASQATSSPERLVERTWGTPDWTEACAPDLPATILAFADWELSPPPAWRDLMSIPLLGARQEPGGNKLWFYRAEVPGPRRIAGLTQQLVAASKGEETGLRMWDLVVARRLSSWLAPGDGRPAYSALPTELVRGTGLLSWIGYLIWIMSWLLLASLALPARARWAGVAVAITQVVVGAVMMRWLALYYPVVASSIVIVVLGWWRGRRR